MQRRARRLLLWVQPWTESVKVSAPVQVAVVDNDAARHIAVVFVNFQVEHIFPMAFHLPNFYNHPIADK